MPIEHVPSDRLFWQSEDAKTYRCPRCLRPVFSRYEGDALPTIRCHPDVGQRVEDDGAVTPVVEGGGHTLEWA